MTKKAHGPSFHGIAALLTGLVLMLAATLLQADEPKGPVLVIPQDTYDAKSVDEGAVIEHTFVILNQGDEVLRVERVKPG